MKKTLALLTVLALVASPAMAQQQEVGDVSISSDKQTGTPLLATTGQGTTLEYEVTITNTKDFSFNIKPGFGMAGSQTGDYDPASGDYTILEENLKEGSGEWTVDIVEGPGSDLPVDATSSPSDVSSIGEEVTIEPGETITWKVEVDVPSDAEAGVTNYLNIFVLETSGDPPSMIAKDSKKITVGTPGVDLNVELLGGMAAALIGLSMMIAAPAGVI